MEEEGNKADNESNAAILPDFIPQVGMEFGSSDEAWAFWLRYGGHRGFEVRKRYTNKRESDGKITSCKFVCANEGHRVADKRDPLTKCPRAETRTDCQVHMNLKLDRKKEILKVSDVFLEHNHKLHLPETLHLMVSQRKISDLQAFELDQKLRMSWLVAKLADHSILATPFVITRIIYGPSANKNYLRSNLQGPIIDDFDGEQALMDKEKDSNEKMALKSFTQLLTGPISDDLLTGDLL